MKGAVLGLETIVSLIGVLAGAAILFVFISPVVFDQLKTSFCLSSGFCGNQTTIYTSIAKQSVDALSCAVSSTAEGKELPCVDKFEDNKPDGPYVACSTKEQLVCCDIGWLFSGEYWMTKDACEKNKYTVTGEEKCGEIFTSKRAENPGFSCAVRNFNLPQTLGEATIPFIGVKFTPEKWIEGYGDPQYLVYYQRFPAEEDTWSFKADWKVYTLIVVSGLPVGRAGKYLWGAWEGFKASKLFAGPAGEQLLLFESKQGGLKAIKNIATREGALNFVKGTIAALKKSRIVAKEGIKRVKRIALLAGIAKTAEWVEGEEYPTEYAESVLAKYNPEAGKIILKVPFNKPLAFDLSQDLKGKPVLVQFRPRVSKAVKQLHLVAPCKLDVLPVYKEAAVCPAYLFNTQTGYTECGAVNEQDKPIDYPDRIARLADSDLPVCQGIIDDFKFTDNPASNGFIEFFRNLKTSKRPSVLENYFDGKTLNIPFFKDVVYQVTGDKNFTEDKIEIKTPSEDKQFPIKTVEEGNKDFGVFGIFTRSGVAQGKIEYKDADVNVYKYCQSWWNEVYQEEREQKETDGVLPKIDCQVGIQVEKLCSDKTDPICKKFEEIKSQEQYSARFQHEGGATGFNVNAYSKATYFNELKKGETVAAEKNTRTIFVGGYDYAIRLTDLDYSNSINKIDFYKGPLYRFVTSPSNPVMFTADADFDGNFESYGTASGCKSDAIFTDVVDILQKGDTNYCVATEGPGWALAENVGYYGGWTAAVVGSAVAILGTGGAATPLVLGIGAGTVASAGFAAISASEISELTGGWPDN